MKPEARKRNAAFLAGAASPDAAEGAVASPPGDSSQPLSPWRIGSRLATATTGALRASSRPELRPVFSAIIPTTIRAVPLSASSPGPLAALRRTFPAGRTRTNVQVAPDWAVGSCPGKEAAWEW